MAEGDYVVLCDQDDIWEPNRVEVSLNHMLEEGSILDVCDRSVIDENGNILVKSYRKAHPNSPEVNWCSGEDITVQAASVCYGIGMALMLDASAAKSMIPFPESTAHDLWLTLGCSELGKCSFTMTPLVKYRRHGGNETGFLAGVSSKDDWYSTRVKNRVDTARRFADRFPDSPHLKEILGFAEARERRSIIGLLKYRRACPSIAKADIIIRLMPNWLFILILKELKAAR
ncbi:MAG: glycosyltransferase [Collinsella sp.]